MSIDKGLQIEAMKQLHHIIEGSILCHAEVIQVNGVRRREHRRGLCLAFEAALDDGRSRRIRASENLWLNQFDRRRPGNQSMLRSPHFTHATTSYELPGLFAFHPHA